MSNHIQEAQQTLLLTLEYCNQEIYWWVLIWLKVDILLMDFTLKQKEFLPRHCSLSQSNTRSTYKLDLLIMMALLI